MIKIVPRPLTRREAVRVHEELKTTPNILGYTVRELERLQDVLVAEEDAVFAGVCFSIDLRAGWTEIAAVYVLPEFRGQGLGPRLLDRAWQQAAKRGRHIYMLSRNMQVIAWMRARGMTVTADLHRAPLAVHWYTARYMMSRHRTLEGFRKRKQIGLGHCLMQGIKTRPHSQ